MTEGSGATSLAPLFAPVAQWSEQLTHNQLVVGSSPTRRTDSHTMQKYMSPYIFAGVHPNTQMTIRYKTCFDSGELDVVARAVCSGCDIEADDFVSAAHYRVFRDARKIFYHLCRREFFEYTCKRLGEYTNRDHSTVVIALKRCDDLLEIDPEFRSRYKKCMTKAVTALKLQGYLHKDTYCN